MQNVGITVKDNIMTIRVDLKQNQGKSKSGKTEIIASTQGNQVVQTTADGKVIKLGLNCYQS